MKKIALIGSTGSIGKQVLNVVRRYPEKFKIISMAGGENSKLFIEQVKEFKPNVATLKNQVDKNQIEGLKNTEFYFGERAFTNAIVEEADVVVVSLVGFLGIVAVMDALNKGKNIALANKESLVVGGSLVMQLAKEKGLQILPIDSEHSAIWQALSFDFNKPFKRLIITASGGAFRDLDVSEIKNLKASDALKHPNWDMGAKITVDCATLANKAFEVIEAHWLYNADFSKIDVIIHRESIIHSMVEYLDNSIIAQMSYPTMELPIGLALSYPERIKSEVLSLDFEKLAKLTFSAVDKEKYPCFDTIIESAKMGGAYPAVANGANEQAVKLFLQDKIGFTDIYKSIDKALNAFSGKGQTFEDLSNANDFAVEYVNNLFGVK